MTSWFKKVLDLTYPITSMFSGASFNSGLSSIFKSKQIEVGPDVHSLAPHTVQAHTLQTCTLTLQKHTISLSRHANTMDANTSQSVAVCQPV